MMLRAVIVDDESLSRDLIKEYLEDFPDIHVIAECASGRRAVEVINEKKPDIVFLDVQMPGMDGFEVITQLQHAPRIVFCTAHSDYALKAFEVNAVDYLLKPYDRKRFHKAVKRACEVTRSSSEEFDHLLKLLQDARSGDAQLESVFVRVGRKIIAVKTADILWIESAGDYSNLHTMNASYLCSSGLGELETKLDSARFERVHRSFIVLISSIVQMASDGEGGYVAVLTNGTKVRVSRTYATKIKHLIW